MSKMKGNIKVKGHVGTWYIIDEVIMFGKWYYLLEHETYGEDAPLVAIDSDGNLVLEDITDGMHELCTHLESEFGHDR